MMAVPSDPEPPWDEPCECGHRYARHVAYAEDMRGYTPGCQEPDCSCPHYFASKEPDMVVPSDPEPLTAEAEDLRRYLLKRARFAEGGAFDREVVSRLRCLDAARAEAAARPAGDGGVLEDAIALGHNLAAYGLGHTTRDWRDCPQTLCVRVRAALAAPDDEAHTGHFDKRCSVCRYLAATPNAPDSGLDVERLARAMWEVRAGGSIDNRNAAEVAAEYARLATLRAPEGTEG